MAFERVKSHLVRFKKNDRKSVSLCTRGNLYINSALMEESGHQDARHCNLYYDESKDYLKIVFLDDESQTDQDSYAMAVGNSVGYGKRVGLKGLLRSIGKEEYIPSEHPIKLKHALGDGWLIVSLNPSDFGK